MILVDAAAAGSLGGGLLIAAFMLASLAFGLGIRYGQRSLLCPTHGRACTRCTECR